MAQTYDLTRGNPTKLILTFFFPMLFTNMLQQIYSIADTAIVGKGLGDDALAAVGNMSSLTFLVIGFSIGLTNGFSILTAQYYGAGNQKNLRRSVASAILLAFGMTALLTIVSMLFLRQVLLLLQTPEKIMQDSLIYGYVIFGGLAASIAYNLCASILRALGDSKTPFYAIVVSTVLNIILDSLCVFVFKTGVGGPAAVTVLAICFRKLRHIELIRVTREDFQNNGSMILNLLKNGIPMAIMNSITAVGCMTVQYFVNGMGVVYTSAYSACSKYINLFMQPACTAGYTMSAFTSQNYGAKQYDRILSGLALQPCGACVLPQGNWSIRFQSGRPVLMLNGSEQIELAAGFLVKCGFMIFTVDFLFVFRSGCQGMGKPMLPMVSGVVEMAFRILVIALFIGKIGFDATAYAEIAAWVGALTLNAGAFTYYILQKIHGNRVPICSVALKSNDR